MARPLFVEEQREKLIQGDDLQQAHAGWSIPNISGAVKSIFAAWSKGDDEKNALKDQIEGQKAAAGVAIGKDETGAYAPVTLPNGSADFQKSYYTAMRQRYEGFFTADLNNALNPIQADATAEPAARLQKMQATLEGILKGAPKEFAPAWQAAGMAEITQRSVLMSTQYAKEQEQLTTLDLKAQLSRAEDSLASAAGSGAPTAQHEVEIAKTVDALVGIGQMGPDQGKLYKQAAREYAYGYAVQTRTVSDVLDGYNSPDAAIDFGIQLEAGGKAEINVTTLEPGPDGNLHRRVKVLTTDDVRKRLPSEQFRKIVATNIKEAAHHFDSETKGHAAALEFESWMKANGSDPYRALPDSMNGEFNGLIESQIGGGAMDSPEGRQKVAALVLMAKRMPDALVKSLSLELNGVDEKFHQAAAFLHMIRTSVGKGGAAIGDHIIQGLPDEMRNFVSAVELGIEYGHPLAEIKQAIQNQADPNRVSVTDAIELFNRSKPLAGQKFTAASRAKFKELTGLADIPPEAESEIKTLFHLHLLASRNADASHAKAVEEVSRAYRKDPIFLNGYAKTHQLPLSNPTGYKTGKTFSYFRDSGNEWLNENILDTLRNAKTNLLPDEIAAIGVQPLGKTVWLKPTDTKLERPQFEVWFKDKNGEPRPVHEKTSDGERPLIVDPGSDRAVIEHKAEVINAAGALRSAVDKEVNILREKLAGVPSLAPPGSVGGIIKDEDLKRAANPDVLKKFNADVEALENGYRRRIEDLETETGVKIPDAKVDHQTLLTPKAAGPGVVASVVGFIDSVLPDGTGGSFLARVAAQESANGTAAGTFRMRGDKGIWQVNTGSGYSEVKRLIGLGSGRVYDAYLAVKEKTGIDLAKATPDDLDKPLISGLFARLYFEKKGKVPTDILGQARLWKDHYNTYLGAGSVDGFMKTVSKIEGMGGMFAKENRKPVKDMSWGDIWDEMTSSKFWTEDYDKSVLKGVVDIIANRQPQGFFKNDPKRPQDTFEGAMQVINDDLGITLDKERFIEIFAPSGHVVNIQDHKTQAYEIATWLGLLAEMQAYNDLTWTQHNEMEKMNPPSTTAYIPKPQESPRRNPILAQVNEALAEKRGEAINALAKSGLISKRKLKPLTFTQRSKAQK